MFALPIRTITGASTAVCIVGAAVIAAAVLDEILQMLLLARFIELGSKRKEALFDKIGAPLWTLSAKIEVAFALGVISNEARLAAHFIRDVRNKFAHQIEALSFDHPDIAEIIEKRTLPSAKKVFSTNRERFLGTIKAIVAALYETLAADIRIRSVEETHEAHFARIIVEDMKAATR